MQKGEGINGDASHNPYVYLVQEHGGLDILEELEEHQSKAVWKKAKRIVDDYWDSENDEEVDVSLAVLLCVKGEHV